MQKYLPADAQFDKITFTNMWLGDQRACERGFKCTFDLHFSLVSTNLVGSQNGHLWSICVQVLVLVVSEFVYDFNWLHQHSSECSVFLSSREGLTIIFLRVFNQ